MSYELMVFLSYSILPAVVAGFLRFKKVDKTYLPMLICLATGLINEVISTVVVWQGESNAVNNNVFYLIESQLLLWQFKCWNLYSDNKIMLTMLQAAFLVFWCWQNRGLQKVQSFEPWFRSVTGVAIVIMCILTSNKLVISYDGRLWQSSCFLFCWGMILYFSTVIVIEVFLYLNTTLNSRLLDAIFKAGITVNVLANLLYFIAVLWIPPKSLFILQ